VEEKLNHILEEDINPKLLEHHGWVELVSYEGDDVTIRFRGACSGCDANYETLEAIIKPKLKAKIPTIKNVNISDGVSEILYDFAKKILSKA